MKKTKLPGGNISLKTKKTEDPQVMAWLNAQTNLMDSLRYLVENEIKLHGIRNLQSYIPMERSGLQEWPGARAAGEPPDSRAVVASARQQLAAGAEETAEFDAFDAAAEAEAESDEEAEGSDTSSEPAAEEIDDEDIEAWS
ncbi:hypothetical protein [Paenibacillus sacheonensis]|uniref:Uncharacterized protein n=1 Tax=Paenibacillus sacheonensis TaxID=742054 RepID=A0A7X4YQJ7_9BACL|nr:hypothetical protein [Paenibacillus sacheonensis]MBM7567831.1 hypothetical protein [Paenibacillus sacheonensis]NBC70721.1 hypothetical protein [Paenibacillus sacheonensis]